ncbi:glycerol-3-phosphate dehydrogenase mitochondrial precursor [Byssothecium circinans]|uniref:Glycerol-3-phosphate dehydrogenase n=1 Tax=Byssothecium circinans TaxID=147558 RepID=A0A6A5U863_9PLEO|nr:glycerol-3-phosphate dehydrogenase mitochondrial precursor [Byssothecium circinans]
MATRSRTSRILRPLLYTTGAGALGGAALYAIYRPREIPGTEAAAVPPPTYGEGGVFRPPKFPLIKSRDEQIEALKRSAGSYISSAKSKVKGIGGWLGGSEEEKAAEDKKAGEDDPYDLLVIGGGATGTGIALDAVTRGLKVALVERDDFSSGTSSKSTKLVHGGVRYLEKAVWNLDYNQYKLVVEALRERRYFLDTAPHLSSWLPIMIPIDKWWKAPYFWAGTKFYDFLAGAENIESSYFLTKSKALDAFPMLKKEGLFGALVYYDGAHNDARMNVSLAMTAALYGATVVSHMEVTGLEKDASGRLNGARVKDCITELNGKQSEEFTIKAKGIINATGPFTDSIRKLDDPDTQEIVAPSSGVHVILPGYYSPADMGLIDPSTSDGRVIFFLPWQGNTIAGTTDTATSVTKNPVAGEDEIEWILKEIRRYLQPDIAVRRGDVLAAWSGIRPLVRDPKAGKTEGLVRNHLVTTSASGLLTCAGGKWTTYREMAEETVDEAIKEFGLQTKALADPPRVSGTWVEDEAPLDGTCQTHRVRLIGAHGYSKTLFINLIQHFGVETEVAKYLCTAYGDRAWTVAALSSPTEQRFPVRGKRISPLYPFIDGEVRYCVRHEYAQTATDVIARRMRLAFLNAQAALEALPVVIDLMSEELHWDAKRKEREWKEAVGYLGSMGLPKNKLSLTRKEVESGRVGMYKDEEYHLYARHGEFESYHGGRVLGFETEMLTEDADKPEETLESDAKYPKGHNPVMGDDSKANK